jgi:hypothetical protein
MDPFRQAGELFLMTEMLSILPEAEKRCAQRNSMMV